MYDRFTHSSRLGRGSIPRSIRKAVFERDGFCCQYCRRRLQPYELTIDHLVPLARQGLDEMINYVTCCSTCNRRKGSMPLEDFAKQLRVDVESLPVHGDPVIDNAALPIQIRLIRKRIFDKARMGVVSVRGKQAQKKIEKEYRRSLWESDVGRQLEQEMPSLPGHARAMIPEIRTIAKNEQEYLLLVELAKSANTRNLIGTVLQKGTDVLVRIADLAARTHDEAMRKRLEHAIRRYRNEMRRRRLGEFEMPVG